MRDKVIEYLKHTHALSERHIYRDFERWEAFAKHLGYQPEKYPTKLRREMQLSYISLFDWESRTDEQLLEDVMLHDIYAFKFR